jgi:hypothetical protein
VLAWKNGILRCPGGETQLKLRIKDNSKFRFPSDLSIRGEFGNRDT